MLTENILDPSGSIVASKRFADPFDGNYYFYNYDLRGSVTSIIVPTDIALTGGGTLQGGSRVTDYTYDEFGNLEKGGVQEFLNETTYTGSVSDTSTGLQYMNARYYDPETGRFLTQDTYTGNPYDPWTQHLYALLRQQPHQHGRPDGAFCDSSSTY
jgi:RHS repeat-associated protein